MPPSGFSQKAINGLLQFVASCYEDLLQEIKDGKHAEGEAIKKELDNINEYLTNFKL
jgi:predicted enzyme involved in methoxymalonyl-ACP biosynthesis